MEDADVEEEKGVAECYTAGNFKSVRSPSFHGFSLSTAPRLAAADMASPQIRKMVMYSHARRAISAMVSGSKWVLLGSVEKNDKRWAISGLRASAWFSEQRYVKRMASTCSL